MGSSDGMEEGGGFTERDTLCLPDFNIASISHRGDPGFLSLLSKYSESPENNAAEKLVLLKDKLRSASTKEFWSLLMEEMCDILGAQCGLVAKRILVDDENIAVEMPPLGEPGSCLMAVAFYLNNGADVIEMHRGYKYQAFRSPCAYMRHDKVFIIPERLTDFVPDSPNKLPWDKSEAFIGIPLFSDGKCFAHFAMIWSEEGAAKRPRLSWSFIEMTMHALEDMILLRILEGNGFAKQSKQPQSAPAQVIPTADITVGQTLKPYARSLSHELRTPMQGIVGMLDIMQSSINDAMENQISPSQKAVFKDLMANMDVVLESSKRAMEAATNIVHAYDLNLQMPDTLLDSNETEVERKPIDEHILNPTFDSMEEDVELSWNSYRKRDRSESCGLSSGLGSKRLATVSEGGIRRAYRPVVMRTPRGTPEPFDDKMEDYAADEGLLAQDLSRKSELGSPRLGPINTSPTRQSIIIRDFVQHVVKDALISTHSLEISTTKTELGETTVVRRTGPRGEQQDLNINTLTKPDVPETIFTTERHLRFGVEKVIDNALKFTEGGAITISLEMARNLLEIRIIDTGCGITEESKSHLFKPHFQQDASISRSRDGLGLSLFNAKAHVRKNLGGDLTLDRSDTHGPLKGSEFLIRLPISQSLENSRAGTPHLEMPVPESRPSPEAPRSVPAKTIPIAVDPIPFPSPFSHHSYSSALAPIPIAVSVPVPVTSPIPSKSILFNPSLASLVPLTILIAEDNPINRKILVCLLRKLGYPASSIHLAFDGREAVSKYRHSLSSGDRHKRINAILMDLWMPNMDGYEATEKILEMDRQWRDREPNSGIGDGSDGEEDREEVKVLAVTADVTSESLDKAKRTGMRGFICKPYKAMDLEKLILQHFRKNL